MSSPPHSASTSKKKRKKKKANAEAAQPAPQQDKTKQRAHEIQRPQVQVQKTVAGARKLALSGETTAALQMMSEAFPALDNAEGIDPWEPGTLLAWASEHAREVELMARFVISLEDPDDAAFPIHEALQSWDELGRLAFATWSSRPWWAS